MSEAEDDTKLKIDTSEVSEEPVEAEEVEVKSFSASQGKISGSHDAIVTLSAKMSKEAMEHEAGRAAHYAKLGATFKVSPRGSILAAGPRRKVGDSAPLNHSPDSNAVESPTQASLVSAAAVESPIATVDLKTDFESVGDTDVISGTSDLVNTNPEVVIGNEIVLDSKADVHANTKSDPETFPDVAVSDTSSATETNLVVDAEPLLDTVVSGADPVAISDQMSENLVSTDVSPQFVEASTAFETSIESRIDESVCDIGESSNIDVVSLVAEASSMAVETTTESSTEVPLAGTTESCNSNFVVEEVSQDTLPTRRVGETENKSDSDLQTVTISPGTPSKTDGAGGDSNVRKYARSVSMRVESTAQSASTTPGQSSPRTPQQRNSMIATRNKFSPATPDAVSNAESGSARNLLRPASTKSMKEMFEDSMRQQEEEKRRKLRELNLSYKIPVGESVLECPRDASETVAREPEKVPTKEEELTLAERKLNSLREAKAAKEARLAQYLEGTESTLSLKERYERARSMQREAELDRLGKIKGTNNLISPDSHSSRGLATFWGEVVNTSKSIEQKRAEETKARTRSQFRATDGTGFVKRRIGQWEELFMCLMPTGPQLIECVRHATILVTDFMEKRALARADRQRRRDKGEIVEDSDDEEELNKSGTKANPELFEIGSTHIYSSKFLEPTSLESITKAMKQLNSKSFPCGVYGESKRPPIDVIAAILKVENEIFLALTILAKVGFENDANSYGVKRIVVFDSPKASKGDIQSDLERLPIFDRIVDIVPEGGWGDFDVENNELFDVEQIDTVQERFQDADGDGNVPNDALMDNPESNREMVATDDVPGVDTVSVIALSGEGTERDTNAGYAHELSSSNAATVHNEIAVTVEELIVSVDTTAAAPTTLNVGAVDPVQVNDQSTVIDNGKTETVDLTNTQHETRGKGVAADNSGKRKLAPDSPDGQQDVNEDQEGEDVLMPLPSAGATVGGMQYSSVPAVSAAATYSHGPPDRPRGPSGDDGDDLSSVGDVLPASPFNFGRATSVANVRQAQVHRPIDKKRPSFSSKIKTRRNDAWTLEDEREEDIPLAAVNHIALDLNEVTNISSTVNCMILQERSYSTVLTGTLKSVRCPSSHYLVVDDTFFEWNRGAAMSGWNFKWPMKSQKTGMRTKRFFVLRDNILSYHKSKPNSLEEVDLESSQSGRLTLTEKSTISKGRYLLVPCFTIVTPYDTLWMKCKGPLFEQERWMDQIKLGIEQAAKRQLFSTKERIESVWHHEAVTFNCIAVDATVGKMPGTINKLYSAVALFSDNDVRFSIDVSSGGPNGADRDQYELRTPFDSEDLGSNLRCVRILNNVIIVGGSNGFVAVCAPAPSNHANFSAKSGRPVEKIMYCYSTSFSMKGYPKYSSTAAAAKSKSVRVSSGSFVGGSSTKGHHDGSSVVCIACSPTTGFFVSGDDHGGLALWKLSYGDASAAQSELDPISAGASLQAFVTVGELGGYDAQRSESIRSLEFMPSGEHLIVSTNERLLLLVIPTAANQLKYRSDLRNGLYSSISDLHRARVVNTNVGSNSASITDQATPFVGSNSVATKSTSITVTPSAGIVIKSKRPDGQKVFINVSHHESLPVYFPITSSTAQYVPPPPIREHFEEQVLAASAQAAAPSDDAISLADPASIMSPLSEVLSMLARRDGISDVCAVPRPYIAVGDEGESEDNTGTTSYVFTVVVSTALYSKLDSAAVRELASVAIQQVNGFRNQHLDLIHFSLPKLRLGFKGDSETMHPMIVQLLPLVTGPCAGTASAATVIRPRQFLCWTELDRVIPGTSAIFSLSVLEHPDTALAASEDEPRIAGPGTPKRVGIQNDSSAIGSPRKRTIALWKVVQEDVGVVIKGNAKCVVYRFEWSEEMLAAAITRMRFYIREGEDSSKQLRESNLSEADRLDSVEMA